MGSVTWEDSQSRLTKPCEQTRKPNSSMVSTSVPASRFLPYIPWMVGCKLQAEINPFLRDCFGHSIFCCCCLITAIEKQTRRNTQRHTCSHTHTCIHKHTHRHTYTNTGKQAHINRHTHTYMHRYTNAHMHRHTHTNTHICTQAETCIYT